MFMLIFVLGTKHSAAPGSGSQNAATTSLPTSNTHGPIAGAPYESTMGLIQKIFYYHVPSWFAMFTGVFTCGIASIVYLFRGRPEAVRRPMVGG